MGNVLLTLERKNKEKERMLKTIKSIDKQKERLLKSVESIGKDIEVLQKAIDLTSVKRVRHVPQKPMEVSKTKVGAKTKEVAEKIVPQNAIVQLLNDKKSKLTGKEILKSLLDKGWKSKSGKPISVVYATLNRLVANKLVERSKIGEKVVFYTK